MDQDLTLARTMLARIPAATDLDLLGNSSLRLAQSGKISVVYAPSTTSPVRPGWSSWASRPV